MSATNHSGAPPPSVSYLMAHEDPQFLMRDEMRAVRIAIEFEKVELILRDWRIRSTIIVFGGSRVPSPEVLLAAGRPQTGSLAARQLAWYEAARAFGRIASERGGAITANGDWRDNVVTTGGGPGLMEAANRGASEAGAPTIGFNISLPTEQRPNPYTTPELTFRFQYFAMRKMHFALRANALAIFPGGFGTLDELFEILTLQQSQRTRSVPVVLYDSAYWRKLIDFDTLTDNGMLELEHRALFEFADTPEALWEAIARRGLGGVA
jgi:uncharacterized protein (TIGR00730 family)